MPTPDRPVRHDIPWDCLSGGGEMGRIVRAKDWSKTALGPIHAWPQSLRTAVGMVLNSRYPMFIAWGEELTFLYNDGYAPIFGAKHPAALGLPFAQIWAEIWDDVRPLVEQALSGTATWSEDLLLFMERSGYPEETYYTFSYSPLPDDTVGIGGMLCACTETTGRVIGERQLAVLREIGARTVEARTWHEAARRSAEALSSNPRDLPFALLYLADPDAEQLTLAGAAGIEPGHEAAPTRIRVDGAPWPLGEAIHQREPVLVDDLPRLFADSLPSGPWPQPPVKAAVVPISAGGRAGALIVGLNPYRLFDSGYRNFLTLVAGQVSASIASAQAYEEEKTRAEWLAELDRAKTAFFSNVSHEFRTPLTLMLGPIEELLTKGQAELAPAAKDQLELVNRNGARLLRLVNNLLDFSRIEAGRADVRYEPTDLAAFTAELAGCFRSAVERAGLRLSIDCPPLSESVYVDRAMWEKIVLNLLSNAFKFTFEGEIEVRVRETDARRGEDDAEAENKSAGRLHSDRSEPVSTGPERAKTASHARRHIVVTVRDTGVGIPADAIPRLFERFYRVENMRSRTHEGSGIGLALVQELITLHGGTVRAESRMGEGSRFTVTMPFGYAHLPIDRIVARSATTSPATAAGPFIDEALRWLPEGESGKRQPGGEAQEEDSKAPFPACEAQPAHPPDGVLRPVSPAPRILVADDNADMRQYVVRLLAARYKVQAVGDGAAALAAARSVRPDLIVSDVMMPGLDGFGLLRELRTDPALKTIPVILLSARAGEGSRIEGVEQGADDYLVKPFSARELLARVQAHLDIARVRRESEVRLAEDLEAMTRLYEVGNLCVQAGDHVQRCLDGFVEAAIALTGASKGHLQVLNKKSGALTLAAHRGFEQPFLDCFAEGDTSDQAACAAALQCRQRVIVDDVMQSRLFAGRPSLNLLIESGVRAVQSTPLLSSAGVVLGVLSTYFAAPHRPSPIELRLMDLLARQAADYLERKWAEEVLRTSEERLRAMFEQAATGIAVVDLKGRFLEINDRLCQIVSRARDEVLALSCADLTHPDDWTWNQARMEEVAAGALTEYVIEERYSRPDGAWVWVNVAVSALRDGGGRPQGLLAVVQDIDARKRAEQTVRESEARFREMADNAPVMVWVTEPNGYCNYLSQSWYDFTGQTPKTGLGFGWVQAVHPDDRQHAQEVFLGAVERNEAFRLEYRLRRKDGEYRWAIDAAAPRRAESGEFLGYIGSVIDITERKEAEKRLFEAHALMDSLLLSSPIGFCYLNRDLRYERINLRLAEMNGLPVEAHLGKHVSEIVPSLAETVYEVTNRIVSTGRPITDHEFIGETAAAPGETRYWNETWYPVHDQKGGIRGFGAVVEDVTERKSAEAALRDAQGRLQQWNVKLEQAVNLKTTELVQSQDRLRAMATELNLAEQRERKRLATELHDHLQQTLVLGKLKMGQGKRLAAAMPALAQVIQETDTVFSDALQYTRTLVAELSPPVLRDHGLAAGLNWLADYMKKHDVSVSVMLPKDDGLQLPDDQSMLLFQSVRELLINSWKHGGTGQATVTMERPDGFLRIQVCDKGAGFDPAAGALHAGAGVSSKFGLLSIRERMRALGGSFEIQSAPGQGTVATLTLPVAGSQLKAENGRPSQSSVDASADRSTPLPAHASLPAGGIRVLLVDDHAMVRQGLRSVLNAYDDIQIVGEAQDGLEAVRLVGELRPRVVIMDISMPKLNGIEATAQIKTRYPDTTVIGLSVNADGENAEAMARAGATRLMTKEAAVESLYGAIRKAVEAIEPPLERLFTA